MSGQDILVVAETERGVATEIARELLGGARQLAAASGGQVIALVMTGDASQLPDGLSSADRMLLVEDPLLANYSPQPYLTILEHVVADERPRVVLMGSTSIGWDLAAPLAARLDAPIVCGCTAISFCDAKLQVTASFYAGKLLADVTVEAAPAVLVILPGSMRPSEQAGGADVQRKASPVPLAAGAVTYSETILPTGGDVDLTQQETLVAVGRGIEQEDNLELAEELADALGGQVCASRPVVDSGWLPATRQIGKSGMTVKPKCYFALGISGAPEHVEGMKNAELIVAINTDPQAPIFDVAHYGIVGDLLDLVPAVSEAITAAKSEALASGGT